MDAQQSPIPTATRVVRRTPRAGPQRVAYFWETFPDDHVHYVPFAGRGSVAQIDIATLQKRVPNNIERTDWGS